MTSTSNNQSFFLHQFIIPISFAFTIHVIASRYYMHETKFSTSILKDIEQINTLMLKDKNFENFLPDVFSGPQKATDNIYRFSFLNIPQLAGTGSIKNNREALIYLRNGKSFMVNIFLFFILFFPFSLKHFASENFFI